MSIIESLTLFFLPPVTDQPLFRGDTDPWMLLVATVAAFVAATVAFLYRPLQEKSQPILQATPLPLNALTFSFSLWLIQVISILSVHKDIGYSAMFLLLPLVLSFLFCYYAFRLIAYKKNSLARLFMASSLITIAVITQNILGFAMIGGVAIGHFDVALFAVSFGVSSVLVNIALWMRFSQRKHALWHRDMSSALLCSFLITLASFVVALLMRDTLSLTLQPARIDTFLVERRDVMVMLIVGFVFITCLNQIVNVFFVLKVRVQHLAKRGDKLSMVMQTVTDAIIGIDDKGTITFFNASAERIFGWQYSEIIGENVRVLMTNGHKYRHDMYIRNFLEHRRSDVIDSVREVNAKRKDGSSFPVRLSIGHHQECEEHDFVAVISDISEQQHLARSLRENAKQYRSLIANLPCIAFREMTGGTRHIVYISDAAKYITGYNASMLTGENGILQFFDRIHHDDSDNYLKVRELAAMRNEKYDFEYRFMTRGEDLKWFREIGHSYRAEDGTTWIDGIIVDISTQKEEEEDMRERMRMVEKASQSKASFLANISYEFRSPMNSILGLADVLIDEEINPMHRHHLEVIKESGNNLMKLVSDVLDTSKLENHTLTLDIGEFSLVQLCRQIEFIARETVQEKGLHVRLNYSDALFDHYVGDAQRIKQLLQNLMRSVLTKTEQGHVALYVLPMNNMVRFAVASYTVLSSKITENEILSSGQTLSATLVTQLIDLMEGNLWFDCESVQSSVVYADLPLFTSQHGTKPNEVVAHYALPPLEVLVIDDVKRNQQELRDMLLQQGIKVLTFNNIHLAEDVIKTQQVDVVLIDAYAGDTTLFPMASMLREWSNEGRKGRVRVIAMTLDVDPTSIEDWHQRGFDDVINKPFEYKAVFSALKRCFDIEDTASNISVLNLKTNEPIKVYFNEAWAYKKWPTTEILLSIVRDFRSNYRELPIHIIRLIHDQPEVLEALFEKVIDTTNCIGFEKLEQEVTKQLMLLREGDVSQVEEMQETLMQTLNASFEQAFACLGVRTNHLGNDMNNVSMPMALFNIKTEKFVIQLAEGQFDERLYKELVPVMVGLVDLSLLATFIAAIENFELDDAYKLFLSVLDQIPVTQESGVKGYGI